MSDLINFFVDEASLLLDRTWQHIIIAAIALAISLVIALPVGVWLGHLHKGSLFAINVSNVLRALPSLALIAISLAFFGLSRLNITIALVALAIPPILTNAYTGVMSVDPEAVEASRGLGMGEWQVLTRVELPLALPLIAAGIRNSVLQTFATATLASYVGNPTLGTLIQVGQATQQQEQVLGAAMLIALLAVVLDLLLGQVQAAVTPGPVAARFRLPFRRRAAAPTELRSSETSLG